MSTVARILARNVAPSFAHDCAACTFLGSLDGEDLYHCSNHGGSLNVRHSSRPSDYGCFPLDMGLMPPKGTGYSLALNLYGLGASRKVTPNAYQGRKVSTADHNRRAEIEAAEYKAQRARKADTCNGCEHCDGEGGVFGPHHPRPVG